MLDVTAPGSPAWWLQRLGAQLLADQPRMERLSRYACGDHDLPEGDARVRETFRRFQAKARTNYTGLVAESVRERLHVVGFRYGQDETSDAQADRIWQANALDADSGLVHHAAGVFSRAFVIVGAVQPDTQVPLITPEDPRQVIAEMDPVNRRRVRAALKMWSDDVDRLRHAVVYLPDSVHYFRSSTLATPTMPAQAFDSVAIGGWEVERPPARNPIGIVPVVPFYNRLSFDGALGEFEDVLDVQDRINATLLDRLVIAKMQAYRQRWVKGIVIEKDAEGNPIAPYRPGVDLLWTTENDQAAFGDFQESDITQLLTAVRDDVKDLAAITRTPPHYLLGEMVNVSAEALDAAETGLVAKVSERMRHFGESWEQVMRLAFAYLGDTRRAKVINAETLWASPKRQTESQMADAAVKKATAGVPWRQRMIDLGYTPQTIDRMQADRAAEAFLQAVTAPVVPQPAA